MNDHKTIDSNKSTVVHDGKYIIVEKKNKLWGDLLPILISVVLALASSFYYDSFKDSKTYDNTISAIKAEARANKLILDETFTSDIFHKRPIFRDLNFKIVENSLSNNTFIERVTDGVDSELFVYLNRLKQVNANRAGLEVLYLDPRIDTSKRLISYKDHLIEAIESQANDCRAAINTIMLVDNVDKKGS
jgi:hypothetical protein